MKSQFTELGIFINPHKIIKSFDENGANNGLASEREENAKKLLLLKKGASVKPVKNFSSPAKEDSAHTKVSLAFDFIGKLESLIGAEGDRVAKLLNSLKNERFKPLEYDVVGSQEDAKLLLDRVKFDYKKYADFFAQKKEYLNKVKEYEAFSSEQYIKTSLAYKLSRKIENLLVLMAKNKDKPEEARTNQINKIMNDLQGGISKPVFNKGGERQYIMKFSDLYTIPTDDVGLTALLSTVKSEYKNDMELFVKKNNLKQTALKFSPGIHATVTYVIQETVKNLLELAIKKCKSAQKLSISIEHLAPEVIAQSPFYPLIFNLPCVQALIDYIGRRNKYEIETKDIRSRAKGKEKQYVTIASFYEVEKRGGHMVMEKNKKIWKGLNTGDEQFTSTIALVYQKLKTDGKLKFKLSDRVKEFLSLVISQILSVLSERFNIHRKHKCRIDPLVKGSGKTRPEEKSIKFETVVEIFDMIFCPKSEETKKIIETICQFKNKLKN